MRVGSRTVRNLFSCREITHAHTTDRPSRHMLEIAFYNPRQHQQLRQTSEPLVLARISHEPVLWTATNLESHGSNARVTIAAQPNGVSLAMSGCKAESHAGQCRELFGNCQLPLPASFTIGDTRFEISVAQSTRSTRQLQKLRTEHHAASGRPATARSLSSGGPSPSTLSRWFAALSSLNHWATSLQELYVQAARCAVEAVGLDGGMVLRCRDGEWEIAASYLPHPEFGIHYDVNALNELIASPETQFHGSSENASLSGPAVVLSPLRNTAGDLVGAVYGYRSVREGNARRTIRYLEAHMIELLAGAVSDGIARIERDAETDRRRVLLEQAIAASQDQTLREIGAEQREVTLLFADLRDSTALAESLDADQLYELLSQVMECLTAAVIDHDGLVIDYYGDGLAAMWNAPADQSEHAELACRAALQMLNTLPRVSAEWADTLPKELRLGIGVHTGMAHVGNTGSRRRAKYGPRGTNVNLTSRVEAATKKLEVPFLVTEATASRLSNRFTAHRLCHAQLPGVERPVALYGVASGNADPSLTAAWQIYSAALQCFEQGRLHEASDRLATIDPNQHEIPARFFADYLQREQSRQHRRRSTDQAAQNTRGVIRMSTK